MKLFDATLNRLESALDVRLEQQNVLNGNLANVDTPGYRPREVDFDKALASAERARETGTVAANPNEFIKTAEKLEGGLDGNGVDLDKTMVELARNSLLYGAAAKAVGKKLAILRYVATDGIG
ncbi:MAG: flagellar basal body rod protein FlgB [Archangium sp.]|nr:flagellar basal body rod protein FlgB [Archangium sp.]